MCRLAGRHFQISSLLSALAPVNMKRRALLAARLPMVPESAAPEMPQPRRYPLAKWRLLGTKRNRPPT